MSSETTAIAIFSLLGVTFVFQAYMFSLFIFLWVLYGMLVPLDIWTRIRVLKVSDMPAKSRIAREGIAEKVQVMLLMGFLALAGYFIAGIFGSGDCGATCITVGMVVSTFMGLFVITEFASILENQIELAEISQRRVNPVTRLLARMLGVLYDSLAKKIEENAKKLNKKDDRN